MKKSVLLIYSVPFPSIVVSRSVALSFVLSMVVSNHVHGSVGIKLGQKPVLRVPIFNCQMVH